MTEIDLRQLIAHMANWGFDLLDPPHTGENYLTQEMGFRIARKHATRLRAIAVTSLARNPLVPDWPAISETLRPATSSWKTSN